ncbi:MAG TPA: nucleotidyltransferase family protein [Fimbriimonadales bacterium]|nr:nucleotidyltransferase family protein [Fimbriimonadales bacterium]
MDALILAGGKCPEDLARATRCVVKANLLWNGRRLVDQVVSALRNSDIGLEKMVCVGARVPSAENIEGGENFFESMSRGLSACNAKNIIVTTADLPFISKESIEDFVSRAEPNAAINWAIVPMKECKEKFPGIARTSVRLREGHFTGGNIALLERESFEKILPILQKAYENRKSPWRLAWQIGLFVLLQLAISRLFPAVLSIRRIENVVSKKLGVAAKVVISHYPEIATDVDTLEQYQAALRWREALEVSSRRL